MEKISYRNSYGQTATFPKTATALASLKERNPQFVVPEVLETLDRIFDRAVMGKGAVTQATDLSLELNLKPSLIKQVFKQLCSSGMLEPLEIDENFRITRLSSEEDKVLFKE